ncbi:hypothetical protein Hanom_Chr12g01141951 [Helianthus anomalus]
MNGLQRKKRRKGVERQLQKLKLKKVEAEANVEGNQEQLSPGMEQLMKDIYVTLETGEAASEKIVKKKRRRSADDYDDEAYIPSPEHVQDVQTPPSSGRIKKSNARKRVVSPTVRKLRIKMKPKPPPEPEVEPQLSSSRPHQSPISHQSPPPHQSPPKQPSPLSSPQLPISTPIHEQPVITSPHILQTPPTSQPPVQTTPGSSSFKGFLPVPENIALEDIGDFNFVTDDVVKRLQKKVEEVIVEKKMLEDREKKLADRVKTVEAESSSLLKKTEADQADIDILKVSILELEEEKARRDKQNEYFKLKSWNPSMQRKNMKCI